MLKISYAACLRLFLAISAKFAFEMSLAAQYRQKIQKKTFILVFKVIQGHCSWCKLKARAQLPISDYITLTLHYITLKFSNVA